MIVYAVDLGSTNIKVVLFDEQLNALAVAREGVRYRRDGMRVEFDPDAIVDAVIRLIRECFASAGLRGGEPAHIVLTGQAESLVLADGDGRPLAPGISWMDERSGEQARAIGERFGAEASFAVTGEPEPVTTWPATKLRWLRENQPDALVAARHVLMIKDYVLLRLTGRAVGEETTRGFTYLYDVPGRRYWGEMAEFCGVDVATLPELVPAGADVGTLRAEVERELPAAASYTANAGALDHFCAMAGTSSYRAGELNASAGTVLALSMLTEEWSFDPSSTVSFHPGLRPGETVLFTCADSGGIALDWFMGIAGESAYDRLEEELQGRSHDDGPLFLPYLTGVNPPEFNAAARGAFIDLRLRHDRVDMTHAVMEGVAHLLRRNVDDMAARGHRAGALVTTGGGSASPSWNQLKADVCGLEVRAPDEQEAACRGAAVLVLAASGAIDSLDDTAGLHAPTERRYHPRHDARRGIRYDAFDAALRRLYGA